ncbi:MAG TPA: hypothetical protein VKQ30_25220 [Ktedonobacterales bacterium]|nr:hypothetical protein [Ktedonobacterales bacterium]
MAMQIRILNHSLPMSPVSPHLHPPIFPGRDQTTPSAPPALPAPTSSLRSPAHPSANPPANRPTNPPANTNPPPAAANAHPASTQIAWRHQARRLCDERNLRYTARYQGTSVRGHELFSVPNAARYGREHVVRHEPETSVLHCDCTASSYGRPCAHVGAVLQWLDARTEAERPRRRAEIVRELVANDYWQEVERLARAYVHAYLDTDTGLAYPGGWRGLRWL